MGKSSYSKIILGSISVNGPIYKYFKKSWKDTSSIGSLLAYQQVINPK